MGNAACGSGVDQEHSSHSGGATHGHGHGGGGNASMCPAVAASYNNDKNISIVAQDYHVLPLWCVQDPVVTVAQAALIRKSWAMMIDENRNMRSVLEEKKWKRMQERKESSGGAGVTHHQEPSAGGQSLYGGGGGGGGETQFQQPMPQRGWASPSFNGANGPAGSGGGGGGGGGSPNPLLSGGGGNGTFRLPSSPSVLAQRATSDRDYYSPAVGPSVAMTASAAALVAAASLGGGGGGGSGPAPSSVPLSSTQPLPLPTDRAEMDALSLPGAALSSITHAHSGGGGGNGSANVSARSSSTLSSPIHGLVSGVASPTVTGGSAAGTTPSNVSLEAMSSSMAGATGGNSTPKSGAMGGGGSGGGGSGGVQVTVVKRPTLHAAVNSPPRPSAIGIPSSTYMGGGGSNGERASPLVLPSSSLGGGSGSGSNGSSGGGGIMLGSVPSKKSNLVMVFEMLLLSWVALDPSVSLIWTKPTDAIHIMTRMIQFFVTNCDKFDEKHVRARIYQISLAHLNHGVSIASYDFLTRSILVTMKRVLGKDYSNAINNAWVVAFSKFFIVMFPHHPPQKQIRIKAAAVDRGTPKMMDD